MFMLDHRLPMFELVVEKLVIRKSVFFSHVGKYMSIFRFRINQLCFQDVSYSLMSHDMKLKTPKQQVVPAPCLRPRLA